MMSAIEADILSEGVRLARLAEEARVPLRALGGIAIRLRAPAEPLPSLRRAFGDLDLVTRKGSARLVEQFLEQAGYVPDARFNALQGRTRLLFYDTAHDRKLDVFVGEFRMCHVIPIDERLAIDALTLPLAELLLTKLQVVELNEKDIQDALLLLHTHSLGDADGDLLNVERVAGLCASDWGLWRTLTANLETCRGASDKYFSSPDDAELVWARIDLLRERIDAAPKSRGWKLRARVGERVRWYELPEEIAEEV